MVLGLNWPVCFPPLSHVRRKSVSPAREVPRSTNLLAGAESLKLWDTLSIYDCGHSNKQNKQTLGLLSPKYHQSELSNEVLYDPVPQEASEIRQIEVESSFFIQ